jgi:hypothetical protein
MLRTFTRPADVGMGSLLRSRVDGETKDGVDAPTSSCADFKPCGVDNTTEKVVIWVGNAN